MKLLKFELKRMIRSRVLQLSITLLMLIGVLGVILKDNVASLIPAIESVSLGNKILDNELNLKNLFNTTKKDFNLLTQKEIEILEQIAKGLSNKEISEKLFLSEGTVRNYISGILEKLELRDRTQLAIYYYTK